MYAQNTYFRDSAPPSQALLDSVNGTSTRKEAASKSASSNQAEDLQATFLRLLIAQLQNQDPTSPMDSSQMTSQLAQINTVSGIAQLNVSLAALAAQLTAGQQTQAALLIGSTVLAPGNSAAVVEGKSAGFGLQLESDATDVQVVVKNSAGQVVDTINLGKQSAGTVPVSWEPKDESGNPLPDGTYTFTATATVGGKEMPLKTFSTSVVQAVVKQPDGTPGLALSNGTIVGLNDLAAIV
jgi:flagellar basal-body rod modification protein FlgD